MRKLQQALSSHGFNPGPIDGDFGPRTEAAVKRFQASRGLVADGVLSPKTSAALASGDVFVPPSPPADPSPSGPVRDRIVALARAELARGVREDAGEDRDAAGRIVEYRRAVTGAGENPTAREPWCADFASFIYRQAGVPLGPNGQGQDYVPFLRDWAQSVGRYHPKGNYSPRPGDLVIISYGGARPDHVTVVTKIEGGRVHTIGGNESDSVKASSHSPSSGYILGYVTPPGS
ncbi:MAG: peptidoglycan-binding protein [Myxococcaceae bacterium]